MPVYKNVTKHVYFQSLTTAGADNTATTPTVKVSQNGGAQAVCTNAPTHLGTGQWVLALTAAEMNADEVSVAHSGAGIVSGVVTVYPEADYTSTRAGKIDDLDATVSSRSTFAGGAVASVTGSVGSVAAGGITPASVSAPLPADVKKINATTVNGNGAGTPWGP
jgi:hypothetical protein